MEDQSKITQAIQEKIESLPRSQVDSFMLNVMFAFYYGHPPLSNRTNEGWDIHSEWKSACDVTDVIGECLPEDVVAVLEELSPDFDDKRRGD